MTALILQAPNKKADEKKLNLTLRMMLGVRVAVGRQLAEPALKKLENDDFTQVGRVFSVFNYRFYFNQTYDRRAEVDQYC